MPFYDRKCPDCGWTKCDSFEPVNALPVLCADCGEPTERAWWIGKPANVIGDECDFVQRNGTKTPIHFRSRIKHRQWLKTNHYRISEDKSALGSKSADIMDPVTMANAAELVARAATAPVRGWRDPNKAPIGITSPEGMLRYLSDQNRVENRGEYGFSGR